MEILNKFNCCIFLNLLVSLNMKEKSESEYAIFFLHIISKRFLFVDVDLPKKFFDSRNGTSTEFLV
jgi:hypothetical protein